MRQHIEGTIVEYRYESHRLVRFGTIKMTVELEGGDRVSGTAPVAIQHASPGSIVAFDAELFGQLYHRPTKAVVLTHTRCEVCGYADGPRGIVQPYGGKNIHADCRR